MSNNDLIHVEVKRDQLEAIVRRMTAGVEHLPDADDLMALVLREAIWSFLKEYAFG